MNRHPPGDFASVSGVLPAALGFFNLLATVNNPKLKTYVGLSPAGSGMLRPVQPMSAQRLASSLVITPSITTPFCAHSRSIIAQICLSSESEVLALDWFTISVDLNSFIAEIELPSHSC
mmetsp:Transcript_16373/g.26741  ORF Transcript_16373/g.26741 Transcript_16373/m.26741 type:complete len:119 (+) Transcript_16373:1028-1384(+)